MKTPVGNAPDSKTLQARTGLRLFPDAPNGVEVWAEGAGCVFTAKNKPQALAFLAGVAWETERAASADRAPGGAANCDGEERPRT